MKIAGPPQARRALARFAERFERPQVELVVPGDDGAFKDAADINVLWRHFVWSPGWFERAIRSLPALRWVHSDFIGADGLPLAELAARGITYTNGGGNQSRAIAEWLVLAMLSAVKHFPQYIRLSDNAVWDTTLHLDELGGKVALMIGYGSIAAEATRLLRPFDVEVRIAVRRPRETPPDGVSRVVSGDAWRDELPGADFVIVTAPATPQTMNMIDSAAFARMRPGSWLLNIARGSLVDEDALVAALDAGRIGGAYLDVFATEPLPPESPLWRRANCIITPHWTWNSPKTYERAESLFFDQLIRYADGEPLRNVVDLQAGY